MKIISLVFLFVCLFALLFPRGWGCANHGIMACMWRSLVNFWESVLSFDLGLQGLNTGCQACVAMALTL